MGHDWGAAQAWMFAIRRVRPLRRLVIMNVPHPTCMRRELRSLRQLRKSWYVFAFQVPWLPENLLRARNAKAIGDAFEKSAVDPSRFPPEVTEVYRQAALQPGALRSMINYYRAAVRTLSMTSVDVSVIETPTLMLWGMDDTALSIETTHGTDQYVAELTLRYLPEVSHWVQQEAPETVNSMLLAWLAGEPVPEAADVVAERLDDPAVTRPP
jgi:epoxide hydrolase 4